MENENGIFDMEFVEECVIDDSNKVEISDQVVTDLRKSRLVISIDRISDNMNLGV